MTTIISQETNPTLVLPQLSSSSPQSFTSSLSSHSMFVTSYSTLNITSPNLLPTSTINGQSITLDLPKEIKVLPGKSRQSTGNLEFGKPHPTVIENVIERTDIFTQTVPIKITTNAPRISKFKLDLAESENRKSSERPGIRKIVPQRQRLQVTAARTSSRPNVVTIISDTVLTSAARTSLTQTFSTNASWVLPQTLSVPPVTSRTGSIIHQSVNSATNSLNILNIEATSSSETFDDLPYITSRAHDYSITMSFPVVELRKPLLFITIVSTKSRMTVTTFAGKLDTITINALKSAIFSILPTESPQALMSPPSRNETFSTFVPIIKSPERTEYNTVNSAVSTEVVVTSVETDVFSLGNRRLDLSLSRSPAPLTDMSMFSFLHTLTPTKTAALITANTHVMSTALLPLLLTSTAAQVSSLMSVGLSLPYTLAIRHEPQIPPLLSLQPLPSPQQLLFQLLPQLLSPSSSLLLPEYSYLQHSLLLPKSLSPLGKYLISSRSSYPLTIRQTNFRKIRSRSVDQCSSYSSNKTRLRYRSCSPSLRLISRSRCQALPKHFIYPQTFLKNSRTCSLPNKSVLQQLDERSHSTSYIPTSQLSPELSSLNRRPILLATNTTSMFSATTPKTSLQTTSLDLKSTPLRESLDSCLPSCISSRSPSCSAIISVTTNSVILSTPESSFLNYPSYTFPPLPSYTPPKIPPPPPDSPPTSYPLEKSSVSSLDFSFLSPDLVAQAREISFSERSAFKQNTMIKSSKPSIRSPTLLLHAERNTPDSAQGVTSINLSLHNPKLSSPTYVSTPLSPVSVAQLDSQKPCLNLIYPPLPLEPPPQRPPPPPGSPPPLMTILTSNKTSTLQTCVKTSYVTPASINVTEPIYKSAVSTLKLSIALRSIENSPKRVSPSSESHSVISSSSSSPILLTSSATPTPPSSPIDKIRYI